MKCHQIVTARVVRLVMEELWVRAVRAGRGKSWVCGDPGEYLIQVGGWSKKVSWRKLEQVRGETVEPGEDAG